MTIVGETFFFEEAENPEDHEFMFWALQRVEPCSEDEVWYVPEPWYFGGDSMTVAQTEYEFYALYAAIDTVPLEKTNYWLNSVLDYTGKWAICGWNLDAEGHFDVTDPQVLDSNGNTVAVNSFADAEIGDYYVEFYTNEPGICYTVEMVSADVYTLRNDLTGQYLATNEDYEIIFVDEVTDYAMWYLYSSDVSTYAWNYADEYAVLVYNDEDHEFQVMDDSTPIAGGFGDYYPSEWFYLPFYQCATEEEVVLYYTTEVTTGEGPGEEPVDAALITMESATAQAGETFTVEVVLENNPGIMGLQLLLDYDTNVLTLVSHENGQLLTDMDRGELTNRLQWTADAQTTENGVLCVLTFEIAEDAEVGEYAVTMTLERALNEEYQDVPVEITDAVVQVVSFVYGDVNDDGLVDLVDALMLRKYLANLDPVTGESVEVIGAGADANADGVVDVLDVMLLRQYLVERDPVTGDSPVKLGPQE